MTNIEKFRIKAGWSRTEMAKKSGVPVRTIDDWENGRRKPRDVYQLKKVADVLQVKIEDLIEQNSDIQMSGKETK